MKTKNSVCEDVSPVVREDGETPPRKKLKQARLPFQILSPGIESSSPLVKNSHKRKLSESADDVKVKIVRPNDSSSQLGETKENVCSPSLSGDCKKSSDDVRKTLPNPCVGNEVQGHADDCVETSKICETVIDLDENESGSNAKGSDPKNEVDRNHESSSTKISNKESSGVVETDVIFLSDSEDNVVTTSSNHKIVPAETQNSLSQNETTGKKQDVTHSPPTTDSEQSEIDDSPIVIESASNGALKSGKEGLSLSKECATNNESEISPKSVDINSKKCVPNGLRTPKSSSPDNTRTPKEVSPQNSLRDNNFKECNPNSETPKQVSPHSSLDSAQKLLKLTPRQLQKQLESAKKKEEKERQRQEREKKKAEEREEREKKKAEEKEEKLKQKLEKEEQKKKEKEEKEEQKRKEKEEREDQKKKEKEEKDKKKQVELEMKNEEKRAKDEEKRKKEDKRQAEVAAFTSFFVPKKTELKPVEEPKVKSEEKFMPFEVKADMRLAPITRRKLTLAFKQSLDQTIESQPEDQLYLDQIRSKKIIPQTSSSTWGLSDFKDDIIILDDDDEISSSAADNIVESYPAAGQLPRPKLLQFWENRRPPYWGTWRKESRCVGPKKPFNRDEKFFDYEIDSDDEWEEEEPGESLHGSDDEKESEDEYEVDNEFFVPHGYLSDEENEEEDEDQSPEMFKTKLKLLEIEFEEEMKQKTERLKPRLFGCIWIDSKTTDCASSQLLKLLSPYQAVYRDGPIVTSAPDPASTTGSPESKNRIPSPTSQSLKRKKFPEAAIPALIKLIHGNVNRREFLIKEFLAYWNKEQQRSVGEVVGEGSVERNISASPSPGDIFKKSVSNEIRELATWIACPDDGPMSGRMCWYVPPETRAAHGLADITLPNTLWSYTFKPKRRESDIQMPSPFSAPSSECNPKQLITKFTKKMTEVERKKQFDTALTIGETIDNKPGDGSSQNGGKTKKKLVFNSSSKTSSSSKTGDQHKKKVPILMSDRMVQELPKTPKNSLMKFMKPQASVSGEGQKIVPTSLNNDKEVAKTQDDVDEDCVILSD